MNGLKVGDKVKIITKGYLKGQIGKVINTIKFPREFYMVQLKGSIQEYLFLRSELQKAR